MINNKTRIISFLMAFILIFTFAFLSPLMVSHSYAFAPAVVLSTQGAKIITGVLVSAGYIIHEGATATADYDAAVRSIANVVYQTLNGAEKLLLMSLSVIDNIVEVPVSLYNSIVNKTKSVLEYSEDSVSGLVEQGISIGYRILKPTATNYPKIVFPHYVGSSNLYKGTYTTREVDMREAQPFFIYRGIDNAEENRFYEEGIEYFFMEGLFDEDIPILENNQYSDATNTIYLTPDLTPYSIYKDITNIVIQEDSTKVYMNQNTSSRYYEVFNITKTDCVFNDCILKVYFIKVNSSSSGTADGGICIDIYDKETGEFLLQIIEDKPYGINYGNSSITNTTYTEYDTSLSVEELIAPTIPNADASANVLTLPTELSETIGLTSTDVNVGTTTDVGTGEGTGTGETTSLLQKILDTLMALGDYILEGIKNIFMPDLDGIVAIKEAIEEKFPIIDELKEMIDNLLDIFTNDNPEPPNIIIPLSKAEGNIDYGQDCIALDLSWYSRYKETVDLFIIGFAYVFFIWRLYQRLPGIISGSDGINWGALSGKSEYSGSGNIGFKPGGGKK